MKKHRVKNLLRVKKTATKRQRIAVFFLLAILIVAVDQISKFWAEANLDSTSVPVIGELLHFRLAYNNAAAFSIGLGATWILTLISLTASILLVWYGPRVKTMSWAVAAGFALGGAVGNLIDRAFKPPQFLNGWVVDFIQIPFNFPIFNLADTFLVTAVILSVALTLRGDEIGGGRAK
jgi:signal peptidase II